MVECACCITVFQHLTGQFKRSFDVVIYENKPSNLVLVYPTSPHPLNNEENGGGGRLGCLSY